MRDQFDIVVVGGGIAGLVAALTAQEGGASVALVEAQSFGGRARTTARDGYLYNNGPHALYLAGHLHSFLRARGMDPTGGPPDVSVVHLLRDGELWPLTLKPLGILRSKLLSPRSRVRILRLMARLAKMNTEQFVGVAWQDWLGNEPDDVAGVIRMLVRTGTYVNAPAALDTAAALTQLKLALNGVRYLDGGWQTMVDSLAAAFVAKGGTGLTNRTVLAIESDRGVVVETSDGTLQSGSAIVAGLNCDAAERLTGARVTGRDAVGGPVHAAVLDLALDRVHNGVVFGIDEPLYLSPHAPVARLAPTGKGLVSLLRYTPDGESGSADTDRAMLRGLAEQAGITELDIVHERYLHRLVVANGFPIARGGGLAGRPAVDALGVDGVFIAGDWVGPVGQLADAGSASAERAATRALAHVAGLADVRA